MITQKPDLIQALKEFDDLQKLNRNWDKSIVYPEIKSAKIVPIMYESIYEEKVNGKAD